MPASLNRHVGFLSRGRAAKPKFHLIPVIKSSKRRVPYSQRQPIVDTSFSRWFFTSNRIAPDISWEFYCTAAMRHSTALRLSSLLNVLSNTSEPPPLRTPCSHTPLWRFVANSHEISGLDEESVSRSSIMPGFMSDRDSVDKHIGTTGTSIPYSLGTGE